MSTNGSGTDHWQPQPRDSGYGAPSGRYGAPQPAHGPGPHGGAGRQMMYDAQKKSAGAAYLLWFFLGWVGAHRFYLGSSGSGAAMLILWLVGLFTAIVGIGLILIAAVGIWWFVDLLLIPGIIRDHNMRLAQQLSY